MATCSNILAWETPWIEEPGRLLSMGSQRVRRGIGRGSWLLGCGGGPQGRMSVPASGSVGSQLLPRLAVPSVRTRTAQACREGHGGRVRASQPGPA